MIKVLYLACYIYVLYTIYIFDLYKTNLGKFGLLTTILAILLGIAIIYRDLSIKWNSYWNNHETKRSRTKV